MLYCPGPTPPVCATHTHTFPLSKHECCSINAHFQSDRTVAHNNHKNTCLIHRQNFSKFAWFNMTPLLKVIKIGLASHFIFIICICFGCTTKFVIIGHTKFECLWWLIWQRWTRKYTIERRNLQSLPPEIWSNMQMINWDEKKASSSYFLFYICKIYHIKKHTNKQFLHHLFYSIDFVCDKIHNSSSFFKYHNICTQNMSIFTQTIV